MTILGVTVLDSEVQKVRRAPGPGVSDPLIAMCADTVDGYDVVKGVQRLRDTQRRKAILEGHEPSEHDLAVVALIDNPKVASGLFPHEDSERVAAATHHVAQRWPEAEMINHPKTYKQQARCGAALDVLDFVLTPLKILDGF